MYRICLIRHGKTQGNLLGRYIGVTDECLCQEGREQIQGGVYPLAKLVFASPLRRCMETAGLIYPGIAVQTEELLRECDFGAFENKNYEELSADSRYQAWVDSGGSLPFPQGESHESFCARCREGFQRVLHMGLVRKERACHLAEEREVFAYAKQGTLGEPGSREAVDLALVVHGGTIMSILEAFGEPRESFYHWQVKNGEGFTALLDEEALEKRDEVRLYEIHPISPFIGLSA